MKQAKQVLEQSDKILESIEAQGKKMLDDARASKRQYRRIPGFSAAASVNQPKAPVLWPPFQA